MGKGSPSSLGYIQLANGSLGEVISATNYRDVWFVWFRGWVWGVHPSDRASLR